MYFVMGMNVHNCVGGYVSGWFGVAVTAFVTSTKLSYVELG